MLPLEPQGDRGKDNQEKAPENNPIPTSVSTSATGAIKKKCRWVAVRVPSDRVTRSQHTERLEQVEIDHLITNLRRSFEFGERN